MLNKVKIAVFGGTGFIGSYIVNSLIQHNYEPQLLIRKSTLQDISCLDGIKVIEGDLSNTSAVQKIVVQSDVIIYAVGIIRENNKRDITFDKLHYRYFRNIVDIAKENNVKRIIYISANGVSDSGTGYQVSKYKAEQYLKNNFTNWTIFRPSVVFGNPAGNMEFLTQLKVNIIDKYIPAPLFFKLNPFKSNQFFKSNPVHVTDLSKIIVKSIDSDFSTNKIHTIGGATEVTWYEMLEDITITLSKKKIFIPTPISIVYLITRLFDRFSSFPITSTQIKMLNENNICDSNDVFEYYGIKPKLFSVENISYLINKKSTN